MWNGLDLSWPWNPIPLFGLIILCLCYGFGMSRVSKSERQELADAQARLKESGEHIS